jgi:PKD repeat protein
VLTAFRRLPLAPSALVVQPDRGWVLVNKPTVVHADPAPQTLTTTILGTAVTIHATPTRYAWDFGDGATLATTDPGRPWPDGTLTHTYARVGDYRVALTTTWSATYTLAGDATARDVPGTATTTSAAAPLAVQERRSHLVATTCTDATTAPGC